MTHEDVLDNFLARQPLRVHRSDRRLARIVREAYPIGVPALIMKSSTDRLGESAGYTFHLGTPDEMLRRIASWLLTGAEGDQSRLLRLVERLWNRHGREDVALAALLLASTTLVTTNSPAPSSKTSPTFGGISWQAGESIW